MKHAPTWALSLLVHLDPNPFGDDIQLGFSWVYEVLDSGYWGGGDALRWLAGWCNCWESVSTPGASTPV